MSETRNAAEIRDRLDRAKTQLGTPGNEHWQVVQLAEEIGILRWVLREADRG